MSILRHTLHLGFVTKSYLLDGKLQYSTKQTQRSEANSTDPCLYRPRAHGLQPLSFIRPFEYGLSNVWWKSSDIHIEALTRFPRCYPELSY